LGCGFRCERGGMVRLPRIGRPSLRLPSLRPLPTRLARLRRVDVVVAVFVAVCLVTGAALVVGRGTSAGAIVDAARETTARGTMRTAMTTIVNGGVGQGSQRVDAVGVVDLRRNHSELEVRMGVPGADGVSSSVAGLEALVTTRGADSWMRYQDWPDSRPWVHSRDDAGAPEGVQDLASQLALLAQGARDVEELGEQDVRGVESTHYRATVDIAVLKDELDAAEEKQVAGLLEQQPSGTIPLEAWVGEGLLRRIGYTVSVAPRKGGPAAGSSVTVLVEYFGFGVPFTVQPPDKSVEATASPSPSGSPSPSPSPSGSPSPSSSATPSPSTAPSGGGR
jgi:hypothetical protein